MKSAPPKQAHYRFRLPFLRRRHSTGDSERISPYPGPDFLSRSLDDAPDARPSAVDPEALSEHAIEWLATLYEDNKEYARFHEEMRERSTYLFVVIYVALFSAILGLKLSLLSTPLAIMLIAAARIGKWITMKHWERVARNTAIAHQLRHYISDRILTPGDTLTNLYDAAERDHSLRMQIVESRYGVPVTRIKLEGMWSSIHTAMLFIGISLLLCTLYNITTCDIIHHYCIHIDPIIPIKLSE